MAKQSSIPVLITRPSPQGHRFAQDLAQGLRMAAANLSQPALTQLTLQPVLSPLMAPEALAYAPPPSAAAFTTLILTSETGAAMAGRLRAQGHQLPQTALCVGDRSASAAAAQGFEAISAAGAAADLVALILSRPDPGPMLYLHGEDRAADLAAALHGQRQISACAIYAQRPRPLNAAALALLAQQGPVLLPLFSPRTARLLAAALPETVTAQLHPVVISPNTEAALPKALAAKAIVAAHPDANSMIEAVILAISRLVSAPSP